MTILIQNLRTENTKLLRQQFQENQSILKLSDATLRLSDADQQIEVLKQDLIKNKRIV